MRIADTQTDVLHVIVRVNVECLAVWVLGVKGNIVKVNVRHRIELENRVFGIIP